MMLRKFFVFCLLLVFCGAAIAADTLTLKDGTTHNGTVVSVTARTVSFKEGGTIHRYPRSQVESLQFSGTSAADTKAESSKGESSSAVLGQNRKSVTLPSGTEIDLTAFHVNHASGVAIVPPADPSSPTTVYVTDRGVDNAVNPAENDGRIFVFALSDAP